MRKIIMDNIIDFNSMKKEKHKKLFAEYLKKANSLKNAKEIDKLVEEKNLSIDDHQFFLGFLSYLEKEKIDPVSLFHSLIKLPKYKFEQQYPMNWYSVVEFCFTFLTILKKNEPKQYKKFIELQKFE